MAGLVRVESRDYKDVFSEAELRVRPSRVCFTSVLTDERVEEGADAVFTCEVTSLC